MGALLARLRPYRSQVALTLALVLVQALAELCLPTLLAGIIDRGVVQGRPEVVVSSGLWMLAAVFAGAAAALGAAWISSRVASGFARDLRSALFRKTTDLSVDQFTTFGTASLIVRTTNDVTQVQSFVVICLRLLASAPLMAAGGLILALVLDPGLALVLLAVIPVLALTIVLIAGRAVTLFRQVQTKLDHFNLVARESLKGVRVIRAFDREAFDSGRFDTANLDLAEVSLKTQKLTAVVFPGMMLIMGLSSVALVWFGGLRIEEGTLQVGGLIAFLQYSAMILFSMMMMSMLFVILPRAAVSAARINEVLQVQQKPGSEDGSEAKETGSADIEFRNVSFRYPGAEQAALENVSFHAPAGKTTALIGGTGAGKTTILQLTARFHDATSGTVLVDGLDVRRWSRAALRRRLGISPQKARLFSGTVAQNLRWGAPEADENELKRALDMSQSSEFVRSLPQGQDSGIDKGANLSGGQKQRLAIARALIRRPAALLFDDSFSALDYKTEAALKSALRGAGTTILLVAQRVATVRDADRVVVLDDGKVAGAGTHRELLDTCPVYREIVASQETSEVPS